jgi:hypothetical protein
MGAFIKSRTYSSLCLEDTGILKGIPVVSHSVSDPEPDPYPHSMAVWIRIQEV